MPRSYGADIVARADISHGSITVPKAEPEAAKPKAWGVPKFMPQQRKRAQPSPASRNAASALAAKKQKLKT